MIQLQPPSPQLLLLIAVLAVVAVVVLIAAFKLHAFLALTLASLCVGGFSGMELIAISGSFQSGVGNTLGFIAVVVGLGTMLGKMLAESGGAEVVANAFIRILGEKRVHWTMMLAAFVIGIPVFFAVGLVLLAPVMFATARQKKLPLLLVGIPLVAGLSASHGLVPPHPGPMVAIATLNADVGKTICYGVLVAIPSAILAGPLFGKWISRRVAVEPGGPAAVAPARSGRTCSPGLAVTLFTIVLPVLFMLIATGADLTLAANSMARRYADFFGSPFVALLIAVLFSFYSFGRSCGFDRHRIMKFMEDCIAPAASIMLVVGAAGGFSKILNDSGTSNAIAHFAKQLPISPLILGWLLAAAIRVAVGSATVGISMSAGLMAPVVAGSSVDRELLVVAMGAGSIMLSHLNDGGFWFVKEYFNMSVPQTLKTWTVMQCILSVSALACVLVLNAIVK